jgi:hypothetical protein
MVGAEFLYLHLNWLFIVIQYIFIVIFEAILALDFVRRGNDWGEGCCKFSSRAGELSIKSRV